MTVHVCVCVRERWYVHGCVIMISFPIISHGIVVMRQVPAVISQQRGNNSWPG